MSHYQLGRVRNATFVPEIDSYFATLREQIDADHFPDLQDYRDLRPGEPAGHLGPAAVATSLDLARPRYNVIVQWLRGFRGQRGIDVGPAFGFLDVVLMEQVKLEIAVAEHPQNIAAYSGLLSARGVRIEPWLIGRDDCPFDDASADVVIFAEVLEHLKVAPGRVLHEVSRLVRPEGTLILTTPNIARAENIERLRRGENILDPFREDAPRDRDVTDYVSHIREYTVGEAIQLVEDSGLDVEEVVTCNLPGEPVASDPLQNHYTCIRATRSAALNATGSSR